MKIYKLGDEISEEKPKGRILKITGLKQGVKNSNRVNVYVNEKYAFSLDLAQVVDYKLKVGREMSAEELTELRKASEFGKLYQRTLEWVLIRPRSVRETRDYLLRKRKSVFREPSATNEERCERASPVTTAPWDADELRSTGESERVREEYSEFSEQIIARLIEKGYLDDRKFAEWYVENRFVKKGISGKRLKMELIKKGISSDIIDEVLDLRNDEEEILKIIAKKRAKYDDEKLINYLVRQGFSFQLVKELVLTYEKG